MNDNNKDEVYINLWNLFTFGIKTSHKITLIEGETIILKSWNWRKFGWVRKAITMKNGIIEVKIL